MSTTGDDPSAGVEFAHLKYKDELRKILNNKLVNIFVRLELEPLIKAKIDSGTTLNRQRGCGFVTSAINKQMAGLFPTNAEMNRFVALCTVRDTVVGTAPAEYEAYLESLLEKKEAEIEARMRKAKTPQVVARRPEPQSSGDGDEIMATAAYDPSADESW